MTPEQWSAWLEDYRQRQANPNVVAGQDARTQTQRAMIPLIAQGWRPPQPGGDPRGDIFPGQTLPPQSVRGPADVMRYGPSSYQAARAGAGEANRAMMPMPPQRPGTGQQAAAAMVAGLTPQQQQIAQRGQANRDMIPQSQRPVFRPQGPALLSMPPPQPGPIIGPAGPPSTPPGPVLRPPGPQPQPPMPQMAQATPPPVFRIQGPQLGPPPGMPPRPPVQGPAPASVQTVAGPGGMGSPGRPFSAPRSAQLLASRRGNMTPRPRPPEQATADELNRLELKRFLASVPAGPASEPGPIMAPSPRNAIPAAGPPPGTPPGAREQLPKPAPESGKAIPPHLRDALLEEALRLTRGHQGKAA